MELRRTQRAGVARSGQILNLEIRPLEEALGDFNLVTRPQSYVLRRVFAKSPDVINGHFTSAQESNVPLIGEIIEAAGRIDRGQEGHVFGEGNS